MKYFAPFSRVDNSSILGRDIGGRAPFLIPVSGVTAGNKEFNFL